MLTTSEQSVGRLAKGYAGAFHQVVLIPNEQFQVT
jgi:hypothetical protein